MRLGEREAKRQQAAQELTPDVLRRAAGYMQEHGLMSDPESYGRIGGPCCTFGTIAMVLRSDPEALSNYDEEGWTRILDPEGTPGTIIEWTDREARTQDVVDLYLAAAERLEAADAT